MTVTLLNSVAVAQRRVAGRRAERAPGQEREHPYRGGHRAQPSYGSRRRMTGHARSLVSVTGAVDGRSARTETNRCAGAGASARAGCATAARREGRDVGSRIPCVVRVQSPGRAGDEEARGDAGRGRAARGRVHRARRLSAGPAERPDLRERGAGLRGQLRQRRAVQPVLVHLAVHAGGNRPRARLGHVRRPGVGALHHRSPRRHPRLHRGRHQLARPATSQTSPTRSSSTAASCRSPSAPTAPPVRPTTATGTGASTPPITRTICGSGTPTAIACSTPRI